MQTILIGIISFFSILFSILAWCSGTIGPIILLINGDWVLLLQLILAGACIPFVMIFAMTPAIIFITDPAIAMLKKGNNFFGLIRLWLSFVYYGVLFGVWSSCVLLYVFGNASSFWGAILASFSTALAPIYVLLMKDPIKDEQDAISFTTLNLSVEISLFTMMAFAILYGGVFIDFVIVYAACFSILSPIFVMIMDQFSKEY